MFLFLVKLSPNDDALSIPVSVSETVSHQTQAVTLKQRWYPSSRGALYSREGNSCNRHIHRAGS